MQGTNQTETLVFTEMMGFINGAGKRVKTSPRGVNVYMCNSSVSICSFGVSFLSLYKYTIFYYITQYLLIHQVQSKLPGSFSTYLTVPHGATPLGLPAPQM